MKIIKLTNKLLIFIVSMSLSNCISAQSASDYTQRILGTWYSEGSSRTTWVYTDDGKMYNHHDDKLFATYDYEISHSCGIEHDEHFFFIKWIDGNGNEYCFEINGINEKNSGILSLTSMQNGKPYLYLRQPMQSPDEE